MTSPATPAPAATGRPTAAPADPPTAEAGAAVPAVELVGLGKSFGRTVAVRDVDLSIAAGEMICLLGGSGSGKTTLLRLVAGFESPTSGAIRLQGRDVSTLSPADREIGMVFQNYALFPHLSAAGNIEYGLRMRGWNRARRRERVAEMVERMRLTGLADRLPRQLSGGQQQRVAIARALAYSPRLLLMDEPLGALDKSLKGDLLQEIRRVHREFSTTIVYVTHDREEALTLADRVVVMQESRMIACAPVQELYLRPPSGAVAQFFSGANLLPLRVTGAPGRWEALLGDDSRPLPLDTAAADADPVAVVRPRDVRLDDRQADPATSRQLPGRVQDVVFLGDDLQVRVELTGEHLAGTLVTAVVPTATAAAPEVGQLVIVGLPDACVQVLPRSPEGSA
jgi:putative spermidine/putrescine transport system ATP-binding protein